MVRLGINVKTPGREYTMKPSFRRLSLNQTVGFSSYSTQMHPLGCETSPRIPVTSRILTIFCLEFEILYQPSLVFFGGAGRSACSSPTHTVHNLNWLAGF